MIRFSKPQKKKMANGREYLELTNAGTWESFPHFAEKYAKQIGAKVISKIEAADIHLWKIEYDGVVLRFVYDDFPNGVSIEPIDEKGLPAIDKLFKLLVEQSKPNGL